MCMSVCGFVEKTCKYAVGDLVTGNVTDVGADHVTLQLSDDVLASASGNLATGMEIVYGVSSVCVCTQAG